jgi:hypothetical protein
MFITQSGPGAVAMDTDDAFVVKGTEKQTVAKQKRTKADPAFMTREQELDFADWLNENPHHYDMSVSVKILATYV